jgi:hypothetical protein
MSTEQEDTALLFELEKKIEHRIRRQIMIAFNGYETPDTDPEGTYTASFMSEALITAVSMRVMSSPGFATNITKAVVQKLSTVNMY